MRTTTKINGIYIHKNGNSDDHKQLSVLDFSDDRLNQLILQRNTKNYIIVTIVRFCEHSTILNFLAVIHLKQHFIASFHIYNIIRRKTSEGYQWGKHGG